jgi:diguanylate cyclase (GGDEF)-like protein
MIRFVRGNVKSDTPLLYLLPVFGILLVVLIWSALSDLLDSERARVLHDAVSEAGSHARVYQQATAQTLRAIDQVARLVQLDLETTRQRGEPFDLAALARRGVVAPEQFSLISVSDRNGNAIAAYDPQIGGLVALPASSAQTAGEAFAVHRRSDTRTLYVGRPVARALGNATLIPLTRRINQPDGSFGGVVAVWLEPARLTDAYDVNEQGHEGFLAILGQDGVFRAYRSGTAVSAGHSVAFAPVVAALQRSEASGTPVAGPADEVDRYAAVRSLAPYNVVAIAGTPVAEILAGFETRRDRYRGYALLASLGIIGVLAIAMLLVVRMKQSHREAESARASYRAAAEGSLDAFFLLRALRSRDGEVSEFEVADANSRALQLLKLPREKVVGARLRTLLPRNVRRRLYRRFFKVLETAEPIEEEIETTWARREARWFRHQVVPIEDGLAVTLRDIDDAKHIQHTLERAANVDSLTSLPNRRHFVEHAAEVIERCKARGTNLGVLFIDLDNFKNVNDTLGHDVGDLLLQAVAVRLQSCIRADDVLWRLGGDEFIVTMEGVRNRAEAEIICRRIADVFAPPVVVREISISTSASIGVAFCPEDAEDANTLLRHADLAMYEAKEFGSGAYQFFTPAMGVRRAARIDIEQDLRHALRRYELFLVYQPQVRLSDGKVTGMEALVRWQHPQHGLMNPLDFIPIAEDGNLIHLLGDYVFQIACSQIRRWQAMGIEPVPIGVNVSPRQFAWDGIAERLLSIIEASGVSPALMQIELTESAIMKDSEGARRKLSELKRRGMTLSVDDFGTGHSSLASLQSFPIDTLKIDRSFVERSDSQDGVAILRAIVLMAHTLRMNVVAEGVETEAQLELLRKIGCDHAQGYLIARPVVAEEVPELLQRLRARPAPKRARLYAHA